MPPALQGGPFLFAVIKILEPKKPIKFQLATKKERDKKREIVCLILFKNAVVHLPSRVIVGSTQFSVPYNHHPTLGNTVRMSTFCIFLLGWDNKMSKKKQERAFGRSTELRNKNPCRGRNR